MNNQTEKKPIQPPPGPPHAFIETAWLSHEGLIREDNEDGVLVLESEQLYMVADGMGGHAGGEVASKICCDTVASYMRNERDLKELAALSVHTPPLRGWWRRLSDWQKQLLAMLEAANLAVYQEAQNNKKLEGMGATVAMLQILDTNVFGVWVGDSRIYRFRDNQLTQMTYDHSLLNVVLENQLLKPEEIERFPHKNVILKAVGLRPKVEMDVFREKVQDGDIYLICSDGLSDMLRDETIQGLMAESLQDCEEHYREGSPPGSRERIYHEGLHDCAANLMGATLDAGGADNVSIILVKIHNPKTANNG